MKVSYAFWVSSTGTLTGTTMTVVTNTSVTVPTGPSKDDGYIIAFGARVQSIASP